MQGLSRLLAIYVGVTLLILLGVHVVSCSRSAAGNTVCCEKGKDTKCYPC